MVMNFKRIVIRAVFCFCISGCGSSENFKLAPVSGRIQVDGKPTEGLRISFEPMGGADKPYPGPESIGISDKDGQFSVSTFSERQRSGAVVGKCRVRIWSLPADQKGKDVSDDRGENYDPVAEIKALKSQLRKSTKSKVAPTLVIPLKYNDETTLSFDVPEKGSDSANFDITSK
jgi:hypothetical protein